MDAAAEAFREFVAVVKALRTPGTGCPWDLEQDHRSLRPYLIEEAHEVIDAIDGSDDQALQEELGDLLLQVVLHAQLAVDRQAFTIADVIRGIHDKMVRRHPHVFGNVQVSGSGEVLRNWEQIKAAEKSAGTPSPAAVLDRVPRSLPALDRAQRLIRKAAKLGHDLGPTQQTFAEANRRLAELRASASDAVETAEKRALLERELGELLSSLCRLAQQLGLDAEESLRACNQRFVEQLKEPGA